MKVFEAIVTVVKKHTKGIVFVGDMLALFFAALFATVLKFDGSVYFPVWFKKNILIILGVYALCVAISFLVFKMYNRMWQYVILKDYAVLLVAFGAAFFVATIPFIYIK